MRIIRNLYERFRVLIQEVAKFGIVGSLAFVITVVLVNVFHSGAGMGPIAATILANLVATVFAFLGNKFWAFRHRKGSHWRRETILFFFFNGIGILITAGVVAAAQDGLGLTATSPLTWPTSSGSPWPHCSGCTATAGGSSCGPTRPPRSSWSRRPRAPDAGSYRVRCPRYVRIVPERSAAYWRRLLTAAYWQPRTADRPRGACNAASCCALVR